MVRHRDGRHECHRSSAGSVPGVRPAGSFRRHLSLLGRHSVSHKLNAGGCGFVCRTRRDETMAGDRSGKSGRSIGRSNRLRLVSWGGRGLVDRLGRRLGAQNKIKEAEALTKRWSGAGIFFSRWLITALGPWVNIASGIARYPWRRFLLWDVLGEVLWVTLYVGIGYAFSNRVQYLVEILGNLSWVIVGLILAVILGWQLVQYVRPKPEPSQD